MLIDPSYLLQQPTQFGYKDFDYLEYYKDQSNNNDSLYRNQQNLIYQKLLKFPGCSVTCSYR